MASKLKVPDVPFFLADGKIINPQWLMFFQKLVQKLQITELTEFGTTSETDGNWRVIQSGNNLEHQRLESGTWTTKHTIAP